jgi:Flp pilus assembly protein TadG
VELAFVLPLIMLLGLGLIQFGRYLEVKQILTTAAREGGRQASTGLLTNAQTIQVVKDFLARAGMPTTNVAVTIDNLTNPGVDAKSAAQLDRFYLQLSLPIDDVNVLPMQVLSGQSSTLKAEATWYSIKDKPYPAPPEPAIE